jgi:dTDP-4-amino-4,6-dideoxygalactose transaminase
MEIKMVDLNSQYIRIKDEVDKAIQEVLDTTAFIQGPQVGKFSSELGAYLNTTVVPCANGTDALQIALMALELKPGDEVILPVHTYVATAEVIALLNLTPVFVDVDPDTFNIDVSQIEGKLTPRTRAIVPVHLYGQCADMEALLSLASLHNLSIVEDAAQALDATFTFSGGKQQKAGTMGLIGTTSFFPSKNLGCFGDGGAIFTSDQNLAEKLAMIANHGQRVKYHHDLIGVNSRLDTLQAAVLNVKLKYLAEYTRKRNAAASYYDARLSTTERLVIPMRSERSTHVFHQYTIKVDQNKRETLKDGLQKKGIPTMIYYPVPLHLQKAYRVPKYDSGSFPVSEKLSKTVLSLPLHTELTTAQLDYICTSIEDLLSK